MKKILRTENEILFIPKRQQRPLNDNRKRREGQIALPKITVQT